jgi:hypothetical protein
MSNGTGADSSTKPLSPDDLIQQCGGDVWASHPDVSREDWKYEVANGNTNLGYWEFVCHTLESQG